MDNSSAEQNAVSFLEEWDKENGYLIGQYDAGATKGQVLVPTAFIAKREINKEFWIAAPMIVTTQAQGHFIMLGCLSLIRSRAEWCC